MIMLASAKCSINNVSDAELLNSFCACWHFYHGEYIEQVVIVIVYALAFFIKAFRFFKISGFVSSLSQKIPVPFSIFLYFNCRVFFFCGKECIFSLIILLLSQSFPPLAATASNWTSWLKWLLSKQYFSF